MVNGGAALNQAIKQRFLVLIPGLTIADGMGSSESGAQASHLSTADAVSTGTFKPGPGMVIVAEELDRLLPPERPEHRMARPGWLRAARLPRRPGEDRTDFPTIHGDRYVVAGDRARWLPSGEIEMLGRDSVTINSGGEKIFVEEVEQAIAGHRGVNDVVVVGRPSERWGQEVVALVVRSDPGVTADELAEHASAFIARYKLRKSGSSFLTSRGPVGQGRLSLGQAAGRRADDVTADPVHDAPSSAPMQENHDEFHDRHRCRGTFTDIVLSDGHGLWRAKAPTDPQEFGRGVLQACELVAAQVGGRVRSCSPRLTASVWAPPRSPTC